MKEWEAKSPEDLPAVGLLAGARELLDAGTEYYTSVQTIIPIAATSEMLFTGFYDRLIRREGDPPGQIFLLGFDSMPIRAEKSLYDLAMWCGEHPELAEALVDTPSDRALELLRMEVPPAGMDERVWTDWRSRFQTHLDRYGHAVYNLDFVNPVPADDPAPLRHAQFYLRGQGQNPHQRQRTMVRRREEGTRALLERLDPARGRLIGWLPGGRRPRLQCERTPWPIRVWLGPDARDAPRAGPPPGRGRSLGNTCRRVLAALGRARGQGRVIGRGRDATRKLG